MGSGGNGPWPRRPGARFRIEPGAASRKPRPHSNQVGPHEIEVVISEKSQILSSKYRSLLASLGLADNEITLYELLLRQGPRSASALADAAELTRTNTYHVLGQLTQKQIVARDDGGAKSV